MRDPRFRAGNLSTRFMERLLEDGSARPADTEESPASEAVEA
jgi:hypothetical protein